MSLDVRLYRCRGCERSYTCPSKARACEADHERQHEVAR